MTEFQNIVGSLPGYRDIVSVSLASGDYLPLGGACHVYVSGTAGQTVVYRTLDGTADQTYTVPSGGSGMIRLGDSLPIFVRIVRQTGTNATSITAGLL